MFELSVPLTFFFAKLSEGGILFCNYYFNNSLALVQVTVSFFNSFFCSPVKFLEIDHLQTHIIGWAREGEMDSEQLNTKKWCNDLTLFHAYKLALIIASISFGS